MRTDPTTHMTRGLTSCHGPSKRIRLSGLLIVSVRAATKAAAKKKETNVKKETNGRIVRRRRKRR